MTAARPRVSVIIPAYRSAATIEACLKGLERQRFRNFETIVVESSQDAETAEIVARFPGVILEQSPGRLFPHAARNRGVELAGGSLLVFTDPDTRAQHDWLEQLVAAADAGHELVVGANAVSEQTWSERGVHLCKYSAVLAGLPPGPRWVASTSNALYTRELFDRVGPFDGSIFAGDALLSWRAAHAGQPPWFAPAAVVEHRHLQTLASLWRERLTRSQEFAETRTAFEHWSRRRAGAYVAALPLLVLVVLGRTARTAAACGWGRTFVATLPLQLAGQVGWCVGEARVHFRLLSRASNGV